MKPSISAEELRKKMSQGLRPLYRMFTLKTEEGEELQLAIRRPKETVAEQLLRESVALKRLAEEADQDGGAGAVAGGLAEVMAFRRRVVANTVFAPGAVVPLFTEETAGECDYLPALFTVGMQALMDMDGRLKEAKGNSEATPTAP